MKIFFFSLFALAGLTSNAQDRMTPELLWKLGRVSAVGITSDQKGVVYSVSIPNAEENKSSRKTYFIPIDGGSAREIADSVRLVKNSKISPDGQHMLSVKEVKERKVTGKDFYPDLTQSTVQIYEQLGYRHWDEWEDGSFSHLFVHPLVEGRPSEGKDIMAGQPYDTPTKPFGGDEDYIWSPDGKYVVYVTMPAYGTKYATSTNTDIFQYELATGKITNLTEKMMGYDKNPQFSSKGSMAWLSMKRDGYEADKNDIIVRSNSGYGNTKEKHSDSQKFS